MTSRRTFLKGAAAGALVMLGGRFGVKQALMPWEEPFPRWRNYTQTCTNITEEDAMRMFQAAWAKLNRRPLKRFT